MDGSIQDLYRRSIAAEWGIPVDEFVRILQAAAAPRISENAKETERASLYSSLYIDDLLLSRLCLMGNAEAWELLVHRYRPKLLAMACQITRNKTVAAELTESMFSDLFSTGKLRYFTGRARLETWMRALLVREYVNRYRQQCRLVPFEQLPELADNQANPCAPDSERRLVADALHSVLAQLTAEQKLLLASHFLDGRSLAEIGRMMRLHETSVGRRLDKTLKQIRKQTIRELCRCGMSVRSAQEAMDCDVRDLTIDIRRHLTAVSES